MTTEARARRDWLRRSCRALLSNTMLTAAEEPGLWCSSGCIVEVDEGGAETRRSVAVGKGGALATNPLALGREPSDVESLWYGRLLARLLLGPGTHSVQILKQLAPGALERFLRHPATCDEQALIDGAIESFRSKKTRYPGRHFLPSGASLDTVIDEVMGYVSAALIRGATDWLQRQALAAGPILPSAPGQGRADAVAQGSEDALIDAIDRGRESLSACEEDDEVDDTDSGSESMFVGEIKMPAPSTARRWKKQSLTERSVPTFDELRIISEKRNLAPPGSRSAVALAKELGRARTTVLAAIDRAERAGLRVEHAGNQIIIQDDQVDAIARYLPAPRRTYPRERSPKARRLPPGTTIFGGDVVPEGEKAG